jgi:hypothetical protein
VTGKQVLLGMSIVHLQGRFGIAYLTSDSMTPSPNSANLLVSLDYAKTSNSVNVLPPKLKQKAETQASKIVNLDLSDLVETVVEGVFVGHSYRKSTFESLERKKETNGRSVTTMAASSNNVMVILRIDSEPSWLIQSQRGGWKRIVMVSLLPYGGSHVPVTA